MLNMNLVLPAPLIAGLSFILASLALARASWSPVRLATARPAEQRWV